MRKERYSQPPRKEFELPNQSIELEKVFHLIYPDLPPEVFDVTHKVLVTEIETLTQKGISTAWVRSGARQLAIMLADEYGFSEELQKRWKIFDPRYRNKPELARKQLSALDPERYSPIPDMDIKAFTDNPWVDVDEEIGKSMSDSIETQLNKPVYHITNSDDRTTMNFSMDNINGSLSAEFGKIPGTNRTNAALTYRDSHKHEVFGVQIAGMGKTTEEQHNDNRNPISNYSNETLALKLSVVGGKVVVDLSGLSSWYRNLSQQIRIDRDIPYDQQREALLAIRSGRIFIHMLPQTDYLPALLSDYYDENTLKRMRQDFKDLKITDLVVAETLRREFTAMMVCDPYAAFVWAIETGADKYFFGNGGTQKLLNALFSDAMTLETMKVGDSEFDRTRLIPALRTPQRLATQRNIFLDSKSTGLSMARNALTNTFKSGSMIPEELDELMEIMSWKNDYKRGYDLAGYYECNLKEVIRKYYKRTVSARGPSPQWLENIKSIWLQLASASEIAGLAPYECLIPLERTIHSRTDDDYIFGNVFSHYLKDLEDIGLITNWNGQYFITPENIFSQLTFENWTADLPEDQFHALELQMVMKAYNAIKEDEKRRNKSRKTDDDSSDESKRLKKAFHYVQEYGPQHFLNILAFIRRFPNTVFIALQEAHYKDSNRTSQLVESPSFKAAQRMIGISS